MVKYNIMDWLSSETFSNIKGDSLKIGTAMAASQGLTGKSVTDSAWLKSSVLTLVGFAAYQVLVRKFVVTDGVKNVNVKMALDDILKVGTMLVVSRFLSGNPLNDKEWMRNSAGTIAGFVAFDLATHRVVPSHPDVKIQAVLTDTVKFGTMFAVSQYLAGSAFDREWLMNSGTFIVGLAVYNYLLV